jgi:hypothetical protein
MLLACVVAGRFTACRADPESALGSGTVNVNGTWPNWQDDDGKRVNSGYFQLIWLWAARDTVTNQQFGKALAGD